MEAEGASSLSRLYLYQTISRVYLASALHAPCSSACILAGGLHAVRGREQLEGTWQMCCSL